MKLKYLLAAASAVTMFLTASVGTITAFAEESSSEDTSTESESEEYVSGDYTYVFNTEDDEYHYDGQFVENSIRITRYTGHEQYLVIPDEIDGYTVTALGDDSFADCISDTVTIPSTLNYIGGSVFFDMMDCTEFITGDNPNFTARDGVLMNTSGTSIYAYPVKKEGTSYVIPNGVNYIGSSAFAYSTLTDVTIPDGVVTIDEWAFSYSSIKKLDLPSSVENIEQFAFAYCDDLSDVTLSSSLDYIGSASFACDAKITTVDIPTSVSEIGQSAFVGTGLTEIRIPSSVESIGYCAFGYDEDFVANDNFVIYGASGSQAETYATETDDDNDYENDFTFVADEEEQVDTSTEKSSINIKMILTIVLLSIIGIAVVALGAILIVTKVIGKGKKK